MPVTAYWAELAYVDGRVAERVRLDVADGLFAAVTPDSPPDEAIRLPGLTIPGFANGHSHAFHRALRGRGGGGTFWHWREQMYELAERLTPENYLALARAVYAEMLLAGYTSVGEFHYVHHGPDGVPYADPNVMSAALVQAAVESGIRLTLLDTCYLAGGIGVPLSPVQRRFSDGDAEAWGARAAAFRPRSARVRLGAAIHSVRAVPVVELPVVGSVARQRGLPLHVHVSEQFTENEDCRHAYHQTPTTLLASAGVLGPRTTAVHATHVEPADFPLLVTGFVCICPTTERDLADGIGPARGLAAAGAQLTLGSDGHSVIDPFEEMRAIELDERLRSGRRGSFSPTDLLGIGAGHASLGWPEAGRIAPGALADTVTVDLVGPRLAGIDDPLAAVVFAGTAADVTQVVVGGRQVVRDGHHLLLDDVPGALRDGIAGVLR